MLAIDRINAIIEILKENKSVMVSDLSHRFNVTEETIRRDLEKLEAQKRIVRVHGGAYLFEGFEKGAPVSLRKQFLIEEKKRLGKICLEYIEDRDTIMLDDSTTSLFIAKEIKECNLQLIVITNFLDIMVELADCKHVKLIGLGGTLILSTRSFNGPGTVKNLTNYNADKAFVSCSSLNSKFGMTDHNENEAQIRKMMIENSERKFLVIDHTKINKSSTYQFADINDVDYIITDKVPNKNWEERVKTQGIKLIVSNVKDLSKKNTK